VLAGQNWSLVTTNSKGITQRKEAIPSTIDAQYVVGFAWKRQAQFRVVKDFCETVWAAVSVENPQATFSAGNPSISTIPAVPFNNVVVLTNAVAGAQTLPSGTTYSVNHIPDVVAKLALDTDFANRDLHAEVFGIYRNFYDRVGYSGTFNVENKNHNAGGLGAGLLFDIFPDFLSFQGNVLVGKGIGSYLSGSLPDATVDQSGALVGISEVAYMLGLTLKPNSALEIYAYGGVEREKSRFFAISTSNFGFGIPTADNLTCNEESGSTSGCAGATKDLWQITGGFWDKLCQGNSGTLKVGLQYSYTKRKLFPGTGGGALFPVGASTDNNMVFGSFRYYPFERPKVK
jgi:hypothetical protein